MVAVLVSDKYSSKMLASWQEVGVVVYPVTVDEECRIGHDQTCVGAADIEVM
jgi:hypothetical protein